MSQGNTSPTQLANQEDNPRERFTASSTDATTSEGLPQKLRVLVAEADIQLSSDICRHLEAKYDVHSASNGTDAYSLALQFNPALIIAGKNILLDSTTGILQALRTNRTTRETPIIFLVGQDDEKEYYLQHISDADDYLSEPYTDQELLAKAAACIKIAARLQSAERQWYHLMMQSPVAIAIYRGRNLVCEMANDYFMPLTGKRREEYVGLPLFEAMPEARESLEPLVDKFFESGEPIYLNEFELKLDRNGSSETCYFSSVWEPIHGGDGSITGMQIVTHEVTSQVLARKATEASETMLRKTAEQLELSIAAGKIGTWNWDVRHNRLSWSREQEAIYGLEEGQFSGKIEAFHQFVHPDDLPKIINNRDFSIASDADAEYRFRIRRTDGEERWIQTRSRAYYENGILQQLNGVNIDVTDEVIREEALRESTERYKATIEATGLGLWDRDVASGKVYTGGSLSEIFGHPEGSLEIPHIFSQVHPEDLEKVESLLEGIAAGTLPERYSIEYRILRANSGEVRWISAYGRAFYNDEQKIYRTLGTVQDVTEQKLAAERIATAQREAAESIRQSEEDLQFAINATELAVWDVDPVTNLFTGNSRLKEWFGIAETDDISLQQAIASVKESDRQKVSEAIRHSLNVHSGGLYDMEYTIVHPKTSVERIVHAMGKAWFRNDGTVYRFNGTLQDITNRRMAEQAVRESENRFRTLAETLPQMIWVHDAEGKPEYLSGKWLEYFGNADWDAWDVMAHPEDRTPAASALAEAKAAGSSLRTEIRLRNKDGTYRWHASVGEPVKAADGTVLKWVGALADIHDQKTVAERLEQEIAQRTAELLRSNEDLQQFAHVASHDLKEPVRKIKIFANMVAEEAEALSPRGKNSLDKVRQAADRMASMIDGVLIYSSLNTNEQIVENIDLNELVTHIESDLEVLIRQKDARIQTESLPELEGAPVLIHQLFYNLINNALKFARPDVPPEISIAGTIVNNKAQITIADNGMGFDPSYAEKIFKSFSRLHTKDKFEGTGLGLALCRRIVERHGGSIAAKGKEGKGATFTVTLPLKYREVS